MKDDRKNKSSSNERDLNRSVSKKKTTRDKSKLAVVPESEMDGYSEKSFKSSKSRKHSRSKD